jgi:hypothetical protein
MSFIDLISKKVYAVVVAALLALVLALGASVAFLKVQVAHGETKYAQLQTKVESERAERERVARDDALEVKRMQAKHADMQQEGVHAFHVKEVADRDRDHAQRDELAWLRNQIHTYASGGGEGEGDAAACRSERDRSRRVGADLEEALGLQGEAESFIRQRDREVKLLKDVITNDRELVK